VSPWPPFNGIGVIVNLKHKERLKTILSGTARKGKKGRSEAKNNSKRRQPQYKRNEDAAIQTYNTVLHMLHSASRSSTEVGEISLHQEQL